MANRADRRSLGIKYPTSTDAWSHDVLVKGVLLPPVGDGPARQVDIEVPDLTYFALRGEMPNALVPIALKVSDGLTLVKLEDEEKRPYFDLMCWTVARQTKKPDLVEMCGGLEEAAEWVASSMPNLHKWAIWQRCVHVFDDADILQALDELGIMKEVQGSDVASVGDLASFPEGDGRDTAAEDRQPEGAAAQ